MYQGNTYFRNVENHSPNDAMSHPNYTAVITSKFSLFSVHSLNYLLLFKIVCSSRGLRKLFVQKDSSVWKFSHKNLGFCFPLDGKLRRLIFHVLKFVALLSVPRKKESERNSVAVRSPFKKRSQQDHWRIHSNREIRGWCLYRTGT
jgi:hypothetical protein